MFRYLVSASTGLFLLVFSSLAVAPSQDAVGAWWAAASAAQGAASAYQPRLSFIRIEETDEAGVATSYEEGELRTLGSGASRQTIVLRAEKNGKDASAEWKKRYARSSSDQGGPPAGFALAPFSSEYAEGLSLGRARVSATGIEVPYEIRAKGSAVTGTAFFNAAGSALGYEQSWTKLPALMKAMSSRVLLSRHDGALVVSSMELRGSASIAFVKKHFRMEFRFSEWERAAKP